MMERALVANLWQCIGRRDTYGIQLETGTYARIERPLTERDLCDHLAGRRSLATYVINEQGRCAFAVFDADTEDGLATLQVVAKEVAPAGAVMHLERSRRGGHGWIFFHEPVPPEQIRAWLAPIARQHKLELYPKQSAAKGVGSLIRLPLGIHRRSGTRYPFVAQDSLRAIARDTPGILAWLPTATRSTCPVAPIKPKSKPGFTPSAVTYGSIREWNATQDPFEVIGRYVELDHRGGGHCPFGEHHSGGSDTHSSFQVYEPGAPGGYCWYCHVEDRGGSVFDFLRRYHNYEARSLWQKIKSGESI